METILVKRGHLLAEKTAPSVLRLIQVHRLVRPRWHPTVNGLVFAPVIAEPHGVAVFGFLHVSDLSIRICPRRHSVIAKWWVIIIVVEIHRYLPSVISLRNFWHGVGLCLCADTHSNRI